MERLLEYVTRHPFLVGGTLVLALSVTAIELALILSMMLAGGPGKASLARDTIFATVMIISGVIGVCVLLGGLRHREQFIRIEGAGPALSALATLSTLVLIMPVFTKSAPAAVVGIVIAMEIGRASCRERVC